MEPTPQKIGGCRIVQKLGEGGMGTVFRARHETLDRDVAVKVLPLSFTQDPQYVKRFLREARAAAQLQHPNVVQVYDAGEQGGQYYIVMEFVDGISLAAKLLRDGPLPEAEGLNYLVQVTRGLAAAHARGLVHRDIKPENLLLNKEGVLKVADFGLVTGAAGDQALTQAGAILGTPLYMSPEQAEGEQADARSDLYSLGATFFRLFTGNVPFSAPTPLGIAFKHRHEPAPNPQALKPDLSIGASLLLLKLMAKRREERFQSAAEAGQAAEALLRPAVPAPAGASAPAAASAWASAAPPPTLTPASAGPPVRAYTPTPPAYLATQAGPSATPAAPAVPAAAHTPPIPAPAPTGAPPAAPPSRKGWVLAAAAVLLFLGAGGYVGYTKYQEMQVLDAIRTAQQHRAMKEYDAALRGLDSAMVKFPENTYLREVRESIQLEAVREQVAQFKRQAGEALGRKDYQAAVSAYSEARTILAKHSGLRGLTPDEALPEQQNKAERLRDFQRFMSEARAAEAQGRLDEAFRAYREAEKLEEPGGQEAAQAAQRVTFQRLVAEARQAEGAGNRDLALELLNRAAELKAGDVSAAQERLRRAIQHKSLAEEAAREEQAGRPRQAAAALEKAAACAPDAASGEPLLAKARTLIKDADFSDALAAGQAALAQRRWAEAQRSLRAALALKPDDPAASGKLKQALCGEQAEQGDAALQSSDLPAALKFYQAALQADPENAAAAVCAREVEGKLQAIQGLAEAARQAEAAGDWEGALKKWQALATQDPAQKAVCEQRANNARYEAFMAQSRACERDGNLEQALVHARAAQPYDSTGGQRAQAQIQALESKVRAREQALAAKGAVETAGALVSRGQVRQAVAALTAAAQANPQDLELANLKTALETVEVIERGYGRLETIRGDAEAAVQTALDADKDDKQVRGWLEQVKAWRVRLTEAAGNPRLAWSERRFETLGPALAGLRSNARDMGQLYTSLSANFAGKAASAAKPKVNVGGFTGGIGGRVFGGVGASADVGDNQKLAAIYDATARTLERCATAARELGAE